MKPLATALLLVFVVIVTVGCHRSTPPARPAAAPPTPTPAPSAASVDSWGLPARGPHLAVHYLPWFSTAHGNKGWSHWRWSGPGPVSDPEQQRPDGKRQIASRYYPLIGPYNSADPAVIRYHLATMKAAGIEIVIALWYGPGSDTDAIIPLLLSEARMQGLKLAICYEEKLDFPPYRQPERRDAITSTATADLRYILDHYAADAAYLKHSQRPVIFQFNSVGACEVGPAWLTPGEWRQVLGSLPQPICYIRQNLDLACYPPAAGAYVWFSNSSEERIAFAQAAEKARSSGQLQVFLSAIGPGFDDSGVYGWGNAPRITARHGTDILDATMRDATVGYPDLIQIVTWNDFNEGTNVEPSAEHGFAYLDAIETWYGQLTGRPVDLRDNRAPLREYLKHAAGQDLIPPEAHAQ